MKKQLLKSKYNELSLKHSGIVKVKPETLNILQCQLDDTRNISGTKYYIVTLTALLLIGTAPILISIYFDFSCDLENKLFQLLSNREYLITHQAINISLILLGIAVPTYTLVLPFHGSYQKIALLVFRTSLFNNGGIFYEFIKNNTRQNNTYSVVKKYFFRMQRNLGHDKESKTLFFYFYILALNFSALLILLLYLVSFNVFSEDTLHVLLSIWLMLPSPIVAVAPTLFFIIVVLIFFSFMAPHLDIFDDKKNLPSRIVLKILVLLETIDKLKELDLVVSQRNNVTNRILSISSMILNMGRLSTSHNPSDEQVKENFFNAAKAFESLIFFAIFPKPDSVAQLRRYTIRTMNIFLTGNLGNLPQTPYFNSAINPVKAKIGVIKKTLSTIGLLVYLIAPVALWIFATNHFEWKFDDISKTLLTVLYLLWAVTGIISFSSALATEVKELLISVIRQRFKATD